VRGRFLLPALTSFGCGERCVLYQEIACHDFFQRFTVGRQRCLTVGDRLAILFKDGIGQAKEIRAGHGALHDCDG
jgi:hypothetical protein